LLLLNSRLLLLLRSNRLCHSAFDATDMQLVLFWLK
jgi:hypothetical protein